MITSSLSEQNCNTNGSYDLDKRLSALETAYAQQSEMITSKNVEAGNIKGTNGDITNITSSKIESTLIDSDVAKFDNLTVDGLTTLKDVYVDTLTIKNDQAASFKKATIEDLEATTAKITNLELVNPNLEELNLKKLSSDNAQFDYVEAGSAVVTGELDSANIDVRGTNTPRLTFGDKAVIEYNTILDAMSMDARNALAIQSVSRPTWNEKTLATLEDVTSGIDIIAAVDTVGDLPDVAGLPNGIAYFVRNIESEGGASGTAIAINNVWEITPYYGLTEYRTALAQDQIDNAQNATIIQETTERKNADIVLQDNIDTLDATVTDNKTAQDLVNTDVQNSLTLGGEAIRTNADNIAAEVIRATTAEAGLTPLNPENETAYVRKGSAWVDVNEVITGVNADFEDVDLGIESHITNDVNGVVIESTLPMKVPTSGAEEMTVDNEKNVLNRKYLHDNISLGRATENTSELTDIRTLKVGSDFSASQPSQANLVHLFAGAAPDNSTPQIPMAKYQVAYTKDYFIYLARSGTGGDVPQLILTDKKGEMTCITPTFIGGVTLNSVNQRANIIGTFHPDFVAANPQYENHFYFFNNTSGYIGLYDGKIFKGVINKDNPITIPNITGTSGVALKSIGLKAHPVIVIAADRDPLGVMIGVNEDGEFSLTNSRTIQTNNDTTNNTYGSFYAGNNHVWFTRYNSNLVTKVNYLGETTAEVITDTSNVALPATALQPGIDCGYETEDGDVCFIVRAGATSAVWWTYIIYCDDREDAQAGEVVKAYKTSQKYLSSNNTVIGSKGFWETQNHLFFSATYGVDIGLASSILYTRTLNTTYEVFNKETKTLTVRTYPWSSLTAGNDVNGWMSKCKTENGYWWIFPTNATSPYAVVIDPVTGASKTVDLGTGTTVKWCSSSINNHSNERVIAGGGDNISVTSKGVGVMVDITTSRRVLLFKGDGEFAIYDYTDTPTLGPLSVWTAPSTFSKGFRRSIAFRDGVLVTQYATYDIPQWAYISLNKENPLAEPTYIRHEYLDVSTIILLNGYNTVNEYRDIYSNDFEKIMRLRGDRTFFYPACYRDNTTSPNAVLHGNGQLITEIDVTNDATDTIFLKDGDYIISEA